jgi:hypothetical protein
VYAALRYLCIGSTTSQYRDKAGPVWPCWVHKLSAQAAPACLNYLGGIVILHTA